MATYNELIEANQNSALRQKITVACVIAAENIRVEDPATANHDRRLVWAQRVWSAPGTMADQVIWSVLAQNKSATLSQIINATDATVQSAVDAAIAAFS